MKIGLVVKQTLPGTVQLCMDLKTYVEKNNYELFLEEKSAGGSLNIKTLNAAELCKTVDLIVSLGGDGTLLGIASFAVPSSIPVLGVNFGKLGFLTEIAPEELLDVLDKFVKKEIRITERSAISCNVSVGSGIAVNDIVIEKGSRSSLITYQIRIDDSQLMDLRADGLIFATPTGSTAYSLAAGGSIVHPGVEVILITPICAHSLNVRPVIVPAKSVITIETFDDNCPLISIDGQFRSELKKGEKLQIKKSDHYLKLVTSPKKDYFDILRTKLNWGLGYRGGA